MSGYDRLDDSDEAALTERRPAGMPPGTFRVVIIIVILLLLINLYALTLVINPIISNDDSDGDGDDKEPDEPLHIWNVAVEAQVIDEDTTWSNIDGPLEAPVVVEDGATLTIVDSHILLLCEDFILFRQPYFTVEEGGALEFEDSVVELVYDPWLDTTIVGPYYGNKEYPYVSRVVNLSDTQDPVIEFDVKWRRIGTEMVVAVQPLPGGGLVTLDTVEPTGAPSDWNHYDISLSDYVGLSVNLVLYFPTFPEDVMFIHDLLVTDRGELLPNDLPLWENGLMPYWEWSHFLTFDNAFLWYGHNSQVIFTEGSLTFSGSSFISDIVPRRGDDEYYKMDAWHTFPGKNIWAGTSDWHIWLDGAEFRLHESKMENIPVEANNSWLEVESSDIESRYDMFTLFECKGEFANSTFESDGVSEALRWWRNEPRPLWAISVQNNSADAPVTIMDCTFEGVAEAIDLDNAFAEVEDCRFKNVQNLIIWSHNSTPGDWETLKSSNTFLDGPGFHYLQTRETLLEVNASYRRGWSITTYDTEGDGIEDFGYNPPLYQNLLRMEDLKGVMLNPQVLVESSERIRYVDHVNISMDLEIHTGERLEGNVNIIIRPDDEFVFLDAFPILKEEEGRWWEEVSAQMRLASLTPSPYSSDPGAYHLWWVVFVYNLYAANITFDVIIDGEIVEHWDETDFIGFPESSVDLEANFSLDVGEHQLDLVVSGQVFDENLTLSAEPVIINKHTHSVMRIDKSTPPSDVRTHLSRDDVYLLMDPGTDLQIENLEPSEEIYEPWYGHTIHIVGSEGASLTLKDSKYAGKENLTIHYTDPLDIHVTGGGYEFVHLDHRFAQNVTDSIVSTIRIDNTTTNALFVDLYRCHLEITDVTNYGTFFLHGERNSTVTILNSDLIDPSGFVDGDIRSFTMEDSHISSERSSGITVTVSDIGEMAVRGCTFDGTWLYIGRNRPELDWTVTVTDCEFLGDGSILVLNWDPRGSQGRGESPTNFPVPLGTISNNRFSGEGAGLLLHFRLYEDFLGDNDLVDGAAMWAWYRTEVSGACSDASVGGYTEVVLGDLPNEFVSPFGYYGWPDEEDVILRLTEGPASASEPHGQVAILTWSKRQYYGSQVVMGSGLADLTVDTNLLYHPHWPGIKWILFDIVEPWPIPMEFE